MSAPALEPSHAIGVFYITSIGMSPGVVLVGTGSFSPSFLNALNVRRARKIQYSDAKSMISTITTET